MRLMIAIPSTFTSVEKNRMLRAYLIGQLARFLGMFHVTHIFVYYDKDPYFDSHGLGRYIVKTLKYAVTPPWLKKLVFPLEETDRYFGVIPPLQIKSHISPGTTEWGAVTHERILVSKHVNKKISVNKLVRLGYGKRLPQLVAIKDGKLISPEKLTREEYIGFWPVYFNKSLSSLLKILKKKFNPYIIGTSRKGKSLSDLNINNRDICVVFGSHHRGIYEMPGFKERDYDVIVNVLERQGTKTIRTEEAVPLSLEALSVLGII